MYYLVTVNSYTDKVTIWAKSEDVNTILALNKSYKNALELWTDADLVGEEYEFA